MFGRARYALIMAGLALGASAQAPVLTAVNPSPLPVGTETVTITGTGFQPGALIYDSYGSNSMIQYASTSVTATAVTTSIYQGSAATSTFCVKNPGTACSNSITVTVGSSSSSSSGSSGSSGSSPGSGGGSSVPVLTAVGPSPLPVGTETVTITGTGFQSGALLYESYGSNSMIQYAPASVTATALTASIYQASAATASFCVKNPGTACSNSITVTIGSSGSSSSSSSSSSGSSGSSGSSSGSGGSSVPVLTAVGPSPLPVGTETVTVTGTGFLSGALLYQSYGSNSMIQYAPASVTSTAVTASIYQGSAATANFCVKNPGTACSNSITVTVGGPTQYTLSVVNGTIVNGSTSGQYAAGATVTIAANAAPAGQVFVDWAGAGLANASSTTTTVTMPAANTVETASYATAAPIPFPVTTHPRLWITQQDLPRLQAWASGGNVAYQGLTGILGWAVGNYQSAFPGAALTDKNPTPASPYPDLGDTQGYQGMLSEENAVILAFNSLIDPNPANRIAYAQAARNLIMYAMNQAALGHASGLPFRDPLFATYNRASLTNHEWPLVVDWIYDATDGNGNAILTASDKATIRSVFLMWAADCMTAETTGGDHPAGPQAPLPQALNSLSLLPNNLPYRYASNNYYLAHARLITMMPLAFDPADDPALNAALPASILGNSLRSYIQDATGAWLYEEYAMMGEAPAVAQAYGVPNNPNGAGFGLASGGLPPEGVLYGESFGYMLGQLLALQTAGFNNPAYSGPQINLIGSPVWSRYVQGFLSELTPAPEVDPAESYNGSVYELASYGDMLRLWVTPDQMNPLALLALLEEENGQSADVAAARWFAVNALPNGAPALLSRFSDGPVWGVTSDLLYYLLLDPTAQPASDPRPNFPAVFYDPGAGRVVAHSDWTPTGTMFDYRASWISINHQDGDGGQFEFYRNGEWLTKGMSNYDNNMLGETTAYHNTLALQNACTCSGNPPAFLQWFEPTLWSGGSQWMEGDALGDPSTVESSGNGYVYAASNLTNLFNRVAASGGSIDAVSQATRSIVWLNNDYIVVYDRATTTSSGLFKQFNLSLVTVPTINGNTATETLPSGQQLFIQTLLPLTPAISMVNGAAALSTVADQEPTQYIMTVQDATEPADTRFLHVLQGANAGVAQAPTSYVQSTAGTAFDGAVLGAKAVFFPVSATAAFSGTTLPLPAGVTTMLITGLTPNAGYTVSSGGGTVSISSNGSSTADAGGVLVVNF